jgi:hypothetical protein
MRDKKRLFKIIEKLCVEPNGCKYLSSWKSPSVSRYWKEKYKKNFYMYFRDRQQNTSYYRITLKGNYIRGWKINYVMESTGESINTYTALFIPTLISGEKPELPVTKKVVIAKNKFKDYLKFAEDFKNNSESLGWFDYES